MYTYNKDLISVIIPCYNGEKYINRCMNALINQTYKKFEIIVVNDGSTNNTQELLIYNKNLFENIGISYKIIIQENSGQAVAVNNALKVATGEYFVWQDIDDFYEHDALESMKQYLDDNESFSFIRGAVKLYNENDLSKPVKIIHSQNSNNNKILDSYIFHNDAYSYCGIFMARFKYFDECVDNREIQISDLGQNLQLILPMAYYGDCGYFDKIVYNIVLVENSHSRKAKKFYKSSLKRREEWLILVKDILNKLGAWKDYENGITRYYYEKLFSLSYKFNQKDDFEKYKNELSQYRKITFKENLKGFAIKYPFIKRTIKFLRKKWLLRLKK